MCMAVLSACVFMRHVCTVPLEARESVGSSGTRVMDGCDIPCG